MRKTRELLWVLLAAVLLPLVLGGCGGGGDGGAKESGVTSDRPAVLLGEMPDLDFMPALLARLTNKTEGEIAEDSEVVVLHDRTIATLTDAQKAGLKKVYERGGIVVLIEPTYDELTKAAGIVGHELAAAADNGAEHFCDIYAFNGDWHTYVMDHTHLDPADGGGEASLDHTAKGAYYEAMMDGLMEWIDEGGPAGKTTRPTSRGDAGTAQVQDLVKAQTVTFSDTFVRSDMDRSSTYKNVYFIYALYDFDHDYDYYIVDLETNINSGLLHKGEWIAYKTHHYYGYWLHSYNTSHQLEGTVGGKYMALPLDTCNIVQPQPPTSMGSESYGFSQGFSLTGTLGFSGMGGAGSMSSGANYSQSRTMHIADMRIALRVGQDFSGGYTGIGNAAWRFQVENLPVFTNPAFSRPKLKSSPPAISVTTAVLYNNWIWRVKNPKANGGGFNMLCQYNPVYTLDHVYPDGLNYGIEENLARYDSNSWHIIYLTPPPRERKQVGEE